MKQAKHVLTVLTTNTYVLVAGNFQLLVFASSIAECSAILLMEIVDKISEKDSPYKTRGAVLEEN
jgi:hypothetical protein